jgi:GntR family transcriptional regulator, transcriptional repressor for pyruvate dehydrogenase complex
MKKATEKPIRQTKLNEMVASRIKDYIIEHSLGEGDRLPTEQQMTEMFGVSRVSVREATRALNFLGIIQSAPRRGLTIGRVDMDRVTEYLGFHFALNDYPVQQLRKTRAVIEVGALSESIERIAGNPAVYQKLVALNEEMKEAKDVEAFVASDLAFHRALIELSDLEPLIAFNSLLEVFFKRISKDQAFQKRENWSRGLESHRKILLELRARNLQKAQTMLLEHIGYKKNPGPENSSS